MNYETVLRELHVRYLKAVKSANQAMRKWIDLPIGENKQQADKLLARADGLKEAIEIVEGCCLDNPFKFEEG